MTKKIYNIFLEGNKIGTTELEYADPPMGVVFGQIHFINIPSGYDFLKTYCERNDIEIIYDLPEVRLISTAYLPHIKVINSSGIEINGQGIYIDGMDSDLFTINAFGVPNPLFGNEFPHHVKAYHDRFNDAK
jgi:hypothetical protein